jgi:hypothetical protein
MQGATVHEGLLRGGTKQDPSHKPTDLKQEQERLF